MSTSGVPLNWSLALFNKSDQHIYAQVREVATGAGVPVNQFPNDLIVKATAKGKDGSAVAEITDLVLDPVGSSGMYRGLVQDTFNPDITSAAKVPYAITISMERAGGTHCERTGRLDIVT